VYKHKINESSFSFCSLIPRLGTAKDSIKYEELWPNPIIRVSKIVSLPNYLILSEKINDQILEFNYGQKSNRKPYRLRPA
jgi:hypothetical protein